jgi:tetratricopeptide (TPR) repeat protein
MATSSEPRGGVRASPRAAERRSAGAFAPLWVLLALLAAGCAGVLGPGAGESDFHLSDLAAEGDPAFRASMRIVLDGLDADVAGDLDLALVRYERSLQVDPMNPYAYLALARHRVEGEDPASALPFLDKSRALLRAQGELSPGVEAHLDGLRGAALLASRRRVEALPLLDRARSLAPGPWSDGRLDADELR